MKPISILVLFMLLLALFGCVTESRRKETAGERRNLTESLPDPAPSYQANYRRVFYVWGNGELVASIDQNGEVYYYHNDPWGKPQVIPTPEEK